MNQNNYVVQSPIVGIYHEISEPIKIGEEVMPKQPLCFINTIPISIETTGEIEKIFCKNKEKVVQGTALFMVKTIN